MADTLIVCVDDAAVRKARKAFPEFEVISIHARAVGPYRRIIVIGRLLTIAEGEIVRQYLPTRLEQGGEIVVL